MARARIEIENQRDFTGGLNLADDPFNLAPNETFDLQNVDLDRRGGFCLRRGSRRYVNTGTGFAGDVDSGHTYVDSSNVRHVLAAYNGNVNRWDGAAWQVVYAPAATTGRTAFAEMNNTLYILVPGRAIPATWTGAGAAAVLTTAVGNYNDDLAAPNSGNFPPCKAIAVHAECMWAANVTDTGAVTKASRVRWSHPGQPEDWRTNDYIDIDPDDNNGEITALVPFGDRLLVFKERAVYAIHGFPPQGFSVQNLTKELGAPSQWAVAASENAVYFWDVSRGAWAYDGEGFRWLFQPLATLIQDNRLDVTNSDDVIAIFHNERLWLAVPMTSAPYANQTIGLVYTPFNGNNGAWTVHTRTSTGWWVHRSGSGGNAQLLGGYDNSMLYEFDVNELYTDQTEPAGATAAIEAWYTTSWFDDGKPAVTKRWKRPVIVVRGGSTQTILVEVLDDYDPSRVRKTFTLVTSAEEDGAQFDVDNWDVGYWAFELTLSGEKSVILRGSPLGTGTAKALRFKNTTSGQDWCIHGVTMKWISKRIRN